MARDLPLLPPKGPARPGRPSTLLASLWVPSARTRSSFSLPDKHRDRGVHWVAGSGSGKSLSLGLLAFFDFLRGVPQVLFDPAGQMIDAYLIRLAQFSKPVRAHLWPQVRYVDMSGRGGRVVGFPLLFRLPGDSLQDVADRFLETCRAIDPQLTSASIQGYNALYRVGAPTGMILAALDLQLDRALELLNDPEGWLPRIDEAEAQHPEVRQAAEFFRREYLPLSRSDRLTMSNSYRAKLEPILLDPTLSAMLCREAPGIDFADVVTSRQTVLLDFRRETNPRKRLLLTRWVYDCLLAYIRSRGPGRHRPLAIHIDEITELTHHTSGHQELFARDLDYLFNVLMRNYNLWVTAAHQQMWQLSPGTQETLLSMGTQVFGLLSDLETAELLARRYGNLDPHRPKRYENVWMSDIVGPYVVEQKAVDFPLDEQAHMMATRFLSLPPFTFYVKGRDAHRLHRVNLTDWMGEPWPTDHPDILEYIRYQLSLRSGASLEAAHADLLPTTGIPFDTMGRFDSYDTIIDEPQPGQDFWETGKLG